MHYKLDCKGRLPTRGNQGGKTATYWLFSIQGKTWLGFSFSAVIQISERWKNVTSSVCQQTNNHSARDTRWRSSIWFSSSSDTSLFWYTSEHFHIEDSQTTEWGREKKSKKENLNSNNEFSIRQKYLSNPCWWVRGRTFSLSFFCFDLIW